MTENQSTKLTLRQLLACGLEDVHLVDVDEEHELATIVELNGSTLTEAGQAEWRDVLDATVNRIFEGGYGVQIELTGCPAERLDYLRRHGITQKQFAIGLIETELDRDQSEREALARDKAVGVDEFSDDAEDEEEDEDYDEEDAPDEDEGYALSATAANEADLSDTDDAPESAPDEAEAAEPTEDTVEAPDFSDDEDEEAIDEDEDEAAAFSMSL